MLIHKVVSLVAVVLTAVQLSGVACFTQVLSAKKVSEIVIKDPSQSICCNDLLDMCSGRGQDCVDMVKPETLGHTCRCVTSVAFEMKRYLDHCLNRADETIALRLEKQLSRMVVRNMPSQTGDSSFLGYRYPGKRPQEGARQPSKINYQNRLLDPSRFRSQLTGGGK